MYVHCTFCAYFFILSHFFSCFYLRHTTDTRPETFTVRLHTFVRGIRAHRDIFMTNEIFIRCVHVTTEEPLAANGNHLGFEIHQNSGYNRNNNNNRNNGYYAADVESGYSYSNSNDGNSNVETSDYFDDKYFETRKHR